MPGGYEFTLAPGVGALAIAALVLAFGARAPRRVLFAVGPLGAVMIGLALATTPGPGDGAVLYMAPVLWVAYFFGRTATLLIVGHADRRRLLRRGSTTSGTTKRATGSWPTSATSFASAPEAPT